MKKDHLNNSLQHYRKKIDEIDLKILSLLADRISLIKKVGELKKEYRDKFFIKSAREADMIKNLISKNNADFPKSLIVNIWRKIITTANINEQSIKLLVHNPSNILEYEYLIKEYYSSEVPILNRKNVSDIIFELENNLANIAIFPLPKLNSEIKEKEDVDQNWWISIANSNKGLKVFTKIPFIYDIKDGNHQLVALAIKDAEESSEDLSLVCIKTDNNITKSQIILAFEEENISANILKFVKVKNFENINFSLVELDGFYLKDNLKFKRFLNHNIRPSAQIIGHYPRQISGN
jgi:chorismate mutase